MAQSDHLTRRQVLTGQLGEVVASEAYHVSSAIIRTIPSRLPELLPQIAALAGVEVVATEGGRIVLVMEGASAAELGERLTAINLMDGVIAASMVFEHFEEREEHHDRGSDPT